LLAAFLLSLREGLEIALVIGLVIGALHKDQRTDLQYLVWAGAASAGAFSLLIAVGFQAFGAKLESPYEDIFEGSMMILAAGVLTWMIFWMQRQAQGLKGKLEADAFLDCRSHDCQ
jgi:high-affinity iron transporter